MPNGAVPYMQYVDDPQYSLAWAMKEMGYYTIAMHPYYSSGWNRTNVYPNLEFGIGVRRIYSADITFPYGIASIRRQCRHRGNISVYYNGQPVRRRL